MQQEKINKILNVTSKNPFAQIQLAITRDPDDKNPKEKENVTKT